MQSDRKKHKAEIDAAYLLLAASATINNEANPTDLSAVLPFELVCKNIIPHLDTTDMVSTKQVSKGWRALFADDYAILLHWKKRFALDFGFDENMLCKALETEILTGSDVRNLYHKFLQIRQAYHPKMPNYVKFMLQDQDNFQRLLFCAAGNCTVLTETMEEDEYPQWFDLACYTNATEAACGLFTSLAQTHHYINYLAKADDVASDELVKELLDITKKITGRSYMQSAARDKTMPETDVEKCHPKYTQSIIYRLENKLLPHNQQLLYNALKAGNQGLTNYLLSCNNNYPLNINALKASALSGNATLFRDMLQRCSTANIQPDNMTLNHAARSGSLECVAILVQEYQLAVFTQTLEVAFVSGSIPLINYLLQRNPDLAPHLSSDAVTIAATATENKSLSDHYLPCYRTLLTMIAITHIADEQNNQVEPNNEMTNHISALLSTAYQTAPTFFTEIIQTMLAQREDYEISERVAELIQNDRTYLYALRYDKEDTESALNNGLR